MKKQQGFHPPRPIRERILSFGPPGVGKTSDFLSIIKLAKLTKNDAKGFIIDSDGGAVEKMIYTYGSRFEGLEDRLEIFEVDDWPEWVDALKKIKEKARPQDWVLVDMITDAWESVQDYYVQEVYGKNAEEFFLMHKKRIERRKDKSKGSAPAHDGKDWDVIKRLYHAWFAMLYKRLRCNVYATAQVRSVRDEGLFKDDKATRQVFGSLGVLPKGEKSLGHRFDTVLLKRSDIEAGEWYVTTVKDRERSLLDGVLIKPDFARTYLMKVAGWKLK